ncbi:MAG: MATE family efflux transporter [Muribaculaceae bacterium]|nr:MATE family efflux transporter [Muribaculaceae bacterium]
MTDDNRMHELAHAPLGRLLWKYSLPSVVGMLVMALYNVVDRIFIGQVVGPEAIAGMTITFPIMNITTAIGVLVGVGASARISIAMGAGRRDDAALILGNSASLTIINGATYIALIAWQLEPLLRMFGAGDATLPYAYSYMMWVLPGMLLTNITFGLNNVLRATGYPVKAMYTMFIGAVVNIVLDAVLVLWLDTGMIGAAIATDIAMAVSGWFVVAHFLRKNVNLSFHRGTFRLRGTIVLGIISIGIAPSIINIASCFINAIINRALVTHGGDMAIGAAGIFVTVSSLMVTLVLGLCMGLQPILGYNYGAGNRRRLSRAFWLATGAATAVCVIGSTAAMIWPAAVARAFTKSDFLIEQTVVCLRHSLWAFSIVGFPIVVTTFYQSIGAPVRSLILSLSRQVIFLIPLMLWLPTLRGVEGVWLSFPLSDILATIVATALVIPSLRNVGRASE